MARTIPIRPAAQHEDGACTGAESFALMVLGDAMLPEFAEGEIIVIEPDGKATDGTYVLARIDGDWMLRQLVRDGAGWLLCALNPAYPALACADLAPVRGVVIQKVRPGRRRETRHYVE